MDLLVAGGTVVTVSPKGLIKNGAVAIKGDRIVDVGKAGNLKREYRRCERIEARGKVIIPGLVNTHHHAAMSLLRGYADDLDLKTWLEEWIWPIEKHMTGRDIYAGALLTAVEAVMGGTTTINTMYHYSDDHNEARAFAESGVRGTVGHVCFSWRQEQDRISLESLARNWHLKKNGLIRVSVDPHAPYTVDPEYMKDLKNMTRELNEKYGSQFSPIIRHMHVAETSDEPVKIRREFNVPVKGGVVEYLDSLDVLSRDVVAAHCVHLTQGDMNILRERQVQIAHCPVSNLKLASGVSPVPQLLNKGLNVSLGTDSSCSNNSSDMFEVMKLTALLHKAQARDPASLPAKQVLRMATIGGARALSREKEIGSLEIGKKADLAIIDFSKPHLTPVYNEPSHIVYSAKASDVDTVIVDGRIVVENREIKTLNSDEVMGLAEKSKQRLQQRLTEHTQEPS